MSTANEPRLKLLNEQKVATPIRLGTVVQARLDRVGPGMALMVGRYAVNLVGARFVGSLQKRISLKFFLNEGREFQVGELQKLDGLQELRRHHQGLALGEHTRVLSRDKRC